MPKTTEQLIQELHQGFYGVPDTVDKGMLGHIEGIEQHLSKLNDSVAKNTTDCAKHKIGIRNIWFVIGVLVVALVIKIVGVV